VTLGPAWRDVLGEQGRVVGVEAVGGDRGGIDETLRPGIPCGSERVQGASHVDLADGLCRRVAGDHEGEVNDDVRAGEALSQRDRVAHVPLPVFHLGPPMVARVKRTPRDADDPAHTLLRLQQRDKAKAEGAGGARDRDRKRGLRSRHASSPTP
jgi:hypothetical protein